MAEEEKQNSKLFVSLYITFCILFIGWLTNKFFRGRRQIHQAFHTIEEQLQRMQSQLDQRKGEDGDGEEEEIDIEKLSKMETLFETPEPSGEKDKVKEE